MHHPVSGSTRTLVIAALLTLVASSGLSAQYLGGGTKTAAEVRIADLEQLRDKFVALADAFPEETYDRRPMEGVRSVRDVFMLIAVEGTILPTMWDFDLPEWVDGADFGGDAGMNEIVPPWSRPG